MSNEELKQSEETGEKAKVITKYDRKMERRAKAKAQEAKSLLTWKIAGIVILVAIIAFALSFPIRSIYNRNRTLFTVGDNKINPVEYDYYYSVVVSNFYDSYGTMLSYYGIDESSDFSQYSYNDTMTWDDYFQELTVEQLQQNEGVKADMKAAGYTYDATEYYNTFIENCEAGAADEGVTLAEYIKNNFGNYATASNLKPIISEAYGLSQYTQEVLESKKPTDDEITEYYNENKDSYDSVDYYVYTVSAELPTEPTELADAEPTYADDGTYTPSDAEVTAAMEAAKASAESQTADVKELGEYHEGELGSDIGTYYKSWLFDAERTAGDTTVVENTNSKCYYVVEFEKRYLSDATGVNVRVIITSEDNGEEIMTAIADDGLTLDSFLTALDKYDESGIEGGLWEDQDPSDFSTDVTEWMTGSDRKEGDIQSFYLYNSNTGSYYTYVMYYVSKGELIWKSSISDTVAEDAMEEYLMEKEDSVVVKDPKKFITYLVLQEEQEAATDTEATTDTTTDTATSDTAADSTSTAE